MTSERDRDESRWVDGNLEAGADPQPRERVPDEGNGAESIARTGSSFEPEEDPDAADR